MVLSISRTNTNCKKIVVVLQGVAAWGELYKPETERFHAITEFNLSTRSLQPVTLHQTRSFSIFHGLHSHWLVLPVQLCRVQTRERGLLILAHPTVLETLRKSWAADSWEQRLCNTPLPNKYTPKSNILQKQRTGSFQTSKIVKHQSPSTVTFRELRTWCILSITMEFSTMFRTDFWHRVLGDIVCNRLALGKLSMGGPTFLPGDTRPAPGTN